MAEGYTGDALSVADDSDAFDGPAPERPAAQVLLALADADFDKLKERIEEEAHRWAEAAETMHALRNEVISRFARAWRAGLVSRAEVVETYEWVRDVSQRCQLPNWQAEWREQMPLSPQRVYERIRFGRMIEGAAGV